MVASPLHPAPSHAGTLRAGESRHPLLPAGSNKAPGSLRGAGPQRLRPRGRCGGRRLGRRGEGQEPRKEQKGPRRSPGLRLEAAGRLGPRRTRGRSSLATPQGPSRLQSRPRARLAGCPAAAAPPGGAGGRDERASGPAPASHRRPRPGTCHRPGAPPAAPSSRTSPHPRRRRPGTTSRRRAEMRAPLRPAPSTALPSLAPAAARRLLGPDWETPAAPGQRRPSGRRAVVGRGTGRRTATPAPRAGQRGPAVSGPAGVPAAPAGCSQRRGAHSCPGTPAPPWTPPVPVPQLSRFPGTQQLPRFSAIPVPQRTPVAPAPRLPRVPGAHPFRSPAHAGCPGSPVPSARPCPRRAASRMRSAVALSVQHHAEPGPAGTRRCR